MANEKMNYDDSAIQILEGLEAVRKRPGMYIGSTDHRGLHHLVYEIVDNSVDEALAGHGSEIVTTIHTDGSVSVQDFGRGMPTGMHESGRPTAEVILTVLHAGGKFGQGGYKTSGGLHGVGASVVNALSEKLVVTINRGGKQFRQTFEHGGKPTTTLEEIGTSKQTGTTIHFWPDPSIFSTTTFQYETLVERLRESVFLLKGLRMTIRDERPDEPKEEVFHYDNGIVSFIDYLNEEKETLHDVAYLEGAQDGIEVEFAFQFNDAYSETILSFVNNVRTSDGGTHETGAKAAMTRAVNDYARKTGLLKEKDKNLDGADIREGLTAIVSVRIPEELLQFEGQTKGKLGTSEARTVTDSVVSQQLGYYLEENADFSSTLVRKAIRAQEVRLAARKAREEARSGKKRKGRDTLLSGKLTPAQSRNAKRNELFLVEGDSAGGSAKQGRDRTFQAILPLRGKVVNTERAKLEDVMKNEEIATIIHTIGAGVGSDFTLEDAAYDKVIIMTDADTDGAHIQVLLLTFFYRYMKPLVEAGKVYIAMPPLYKVYKGVGKKEKLRYAWTDEDLEEAIQEIGKGYQIQRYKGLGEMEPVQLWETTMDPATRTLIRVTAERSEKSDKQVSTLMGDKVAPRRAWIEKNVDFSMEEGDSLLQNEHLHTETEGADKL